MLSLEAARANRLWTDWDNLLIPAPWFLGRRNVKPSLDDLLPLLRLPADVATEARAVIGRLRLRPIDARGVYGFWAAQSVGDDVVVYTNDARATEIARVHTFRQQEVQHAGEPNVSLADFVAPRESFAPDYIGAFVLTVDAGGADLARSAGIEPAEAVAGVLAARLAEAFAEFLHRQAREDWGYGANESRSRDDLVAGRFRGVRVSPGSPALPDIGVGAALERLLHAHEIGVSLDGSFAVRPAASVMGLYFSHARATPFRVGRIGRDQIEDYAARRGEPAADVERRVAALVAG